MKLTALMTLFFSGFLYSILAMGNSMSTHNTDFFRKANLDPSADLLADPKFRLLLDQFREHMKAISHLPLSEQRRIDAELALNNSKCCESVNRIENLEI